ncbi:hypothetical protein BCR42DRAFT_428546 [Absidia repens]|uniref:Uncharacterized protein n=1 Tax=Absidia repens TaxID=90262 RepID=A0A1X2HZU9_9FUNG|nr:hypothetical protein BCR42DRAFT_428546 [Absidia repens]
MQKPDLIGKTCIVGFTIMGNKINMLLMYAPSSGYVARTTRTVPIYFSRDTLEFADGMCKLLTLGICGTTVTRTNPSRLCILQVIAQQQYHHQQPTIRTSCFPSYSLLLFLLLLLLFSLHYRHLSYFVYILLLTHFIV